LKNCRKCGNSCGEGYVCRDGSCVVPEGGKVCDNRVVFTNTDSSNCVDCGIKCSLDRTCLSGSCECSMKTQTKCGMSCFYLRSDSNNCGKCGNVCPQGIFCTDSTCQFL